MKKMTQQQKNIQKWLILLILPVLLLLITAVVQFITHFSLNSSGLEVQTTTQTWVSFFNVISIIAGIVGFILIILTPLWLVYLVRDLEGYKRKKSVAVVCAVFFSYFTWIYTWKKDSTKFWINLALTIITFGYWSPVAWIWSVVDTASKPDKFYTNFK